MDEVIYAYTRQQAIEDGVLHDVSELAKEAGFQFPVAVTAAAWAASVAVPKACPWQDETGRLWDLLMMLRHGVRVSEGGAVIYFDVLVQNDERAPRPLRLKAVCGPGDTPSPVITVMCVDED
jgi:hypothetical protein